MRFTMMATLEIHTRNGSFQMKICDTEDLRYNKCICSLKSALKRVWGCRESQHNAE